MNHFLGYPGNKEPWIGTRGGKTKHGYKDENLSWEEQKTLSSNEGGYFDGEPYGEYTLPDVLVEKNTDDALDSNVYSDDSIFLETSTIRLSPSECLYFISFNSSSIASILLWNIELSLFSFLLVTPSFAVLDDSLKADICWFY